MKIKRSKWYIYLVLVIVMITYIVFIFNKNTDIETKLDEVKLKTEINEISKNSFAIMVEKEDGSGYEVSDTFPSDMSLNPNLSGCIDEDGKKISGSLLYKDGKVSVYVNSTAYCYLYFYNDDEVPIVTASVINNETDNVRMIINSSESGTNCVNTSSTTEDMTNCVFEGSIYGNTTLTTNAFASSGTYYAHVQDGAGNVGISNGVELKVKSSGSSFGNELLENPTSGLNTTLEGGLYRYQGTSVDNYICFGTSNKDTCLANTDAYMYRIIGITENGKIKLIKSEALESTFQWSSSSSDIIWSDCDLYKGLNGISGGSYSNLFIGNTSYMPSGWEDKIATTTWKYGSNDTISLTADALYNVEDAWTDTVDAKIGLIYAHDYAYAYQSGGLNCSGSGKYSTCKTSWMYINVSDSGAPSAAEWTMSKHSINAYYITSGGAVMDGTLTKVYSVRPVFFLKSDIEFIGGTGTSTDPFIIQ